MGSQPLPSDRMRAHILILLPCLIAASPQQGGGGFFADVGNAFNSLFNSNSGSNRPAQSPQQRPPIRQQRPPQFQPQPQQFQQQQQFQQPQQFQSQQQPQQQFQQQQFQPRPPPQTRPQPQFQSQQTQFQSQPQRQQAPSQQFQSQPQFQSQQVQSQQFSQTSQSVRQVNECPLRPTPNHSWNRIGFVVTWKFKGADNLPITGCNKFTQAEAQEYCNAMNMEPVSLNTREKQDEFNRLIASGAQRYFWTGGEVHHENSIQGDERNLTGTVSWNNKKVPQIRFSD